MRNKRGGGAANTREQPTARRKTQKRRERTASREARGRQKKQHTAPRLRAPGAGNQQKPETTGAHKKKQKNRAPRGRDENRETQRGGGSIHQGATNGQAGNTKEARACSEQRSGRPPKQTTHSAKTQGTRGGKPEKARDSGGGDRGAHNEREEKKRKKGAPSGDDKKSETERVGGGRNRHGAANGEAGNTNKARAHREQRSRRPKKQTTHSANAQRTRGRKPAKARDNGGAQRTEKKHRAPKGSDENRETQKGRGGGQQPPESSQRQGGKQKQGQSARRPQKREANKTNSTQRQGRGHPGPETRESQRQRGRTTREKKKHRPEGGGKEKRSAKARGTVGREPKKAIDKGGAHKGKKKGGESGRETRGGQTKDQKRGNPKPERAEQSGKTERPEERGRRTKMLPGVRPARPGLEGRAHAHTHETRAWRPSTRKARCRRPHGTAPVHRPSPKSKDGRYGKPDASVTGSTPVNHRSASSPRPTPEGPARDNPIVGPRTGTIRSEPSAPASAGASGRHNEPGSRPASACPAQPPRKSRGKSPQDGKRHHGVRKADWSTESNRTGRRASHHAGPRGTPERHAAGHNHGTQTCAMQRPPARCRKPGQRAPQPHNHGRGATVKGRRGQAAPERPDAPDWIVRGGPSGRSRRPPDRSIQKPVAVEAQDRIIGGGTSSRRHGEPEKRPRGRCRGEAAKPSGGRGRGEAGKTR